jgi:hypothetical protein
VQQTAAKDRERRILQLTIDEISQMEGDVNLYKGVGKMCANQLYLDDLTVHSHLSCARFMMVPRKTMEAELKAQEKELSDDINNLNKKASRTPSIVFHSLLIFAVSQNSWRSNSAMHRTSYAIL